MSCPKCGSDNITKSGNHDGDTYEECDDCGCEFNFSDGYRHISIGEYS